MPRLIDADVLFSTHLIWNAPTVDAVQVVRCGECENWQSGWKPSAAKDGTHFCAIVGLCTRADWYCADGERKDDGND